MLKIICLFVLAITVSCQVTNVQLDGDDQHFCLGADDNSTVTNATISFTVPADEDLQVHLDLIDPTGLATISETDFCGAAMSYEAIVDLQFNVASTTSYQVVVCTGLTTACGVNGTSPITDCSGVDDEETYTFDVNIYGEITTTVTLLSPTDGETVLMAEEGDKCNLENPTMTWEAHADAASYDVQFARGRFDGNEDNYELMTHHSTTSTSFKPSFGVNSASTFHWRVRAANPGCFGPWSDSNRDFSTGTFLFYGTSSVQFSTDSLLPNYDEDTIRPLLKNLGGPDVSSEEEVIIYRVDPDNNNNEVDFRIFYFVKDQTKAGNINSYLTDQYENNGTHYLALGDHGFQFEENTLQTAFTADIDSCESAGSQVLSWLAALIY